MKRKIFAAITAAAITASAAWLTSGKDDKPKMRKKMRKWCAQNRF